jgi:hypothetical protein
MTSKTFTNRENLCYLIAAINLLLFDRKYQLNRLKTNQLDKDIAELLTAINNRGNSQADICNLYTTINKFRKKEGLKEWIPYEFYNEA